MTQRHDMYNNVHKGLRRALCALLTQAGSATGPSELTSVAARWQVLSRLLEAHHHHEDEFIGPHLERLTAAVFARMQRDHAALRRQIGALGTAARELERAEPNQLARLGRGFYRQLAAFIGEYFTHMTDEECAYVEALQAAYSDAELAGIEAELVASVEPGLMALFSAEMLQAMNGDERFELLADMRRNAPAPAFEGVSQLAAALLEPAALRSLERRLSEVAHA